MRALFQFFSGSPKKAADRFAPLILSLSDPKAATDFDSVTTASQTLEDKLNGLSAEKRAAVLQIIHDWYSEGAVGPAFLGAYERNKEIVYELYRHWMPMQERLWPVGHERLRAQYQLSSDRDDVERYIQNIRDWEGGEYPSMRHDPSWFAPGGLERLREGVSQSGNWCDAVARFVIRYRVARKRIPS